LRKIGKKKRIGKRKRKIGKRKNGRFGTSHFFCVFFFNYKKKRNLVLRGLDL
jgi:hypothetical protein